MNFIYFELFLFEWLYKGTTNAHLRRWFASFFPRNPTSQKIKNLPNVKGKLSLLVLFSTREGVGHSLVDTRETCIFVSKALWHRTFKKLDGSLIFNLFRMYQSIYSSNSANFMKK